MLDTTQQESPLFPPFLEGATVEKTINSEHMVTFIGKTAAGGRFVLIDDYKTAVTITDSHLTNE